MEERTIAGCWYGSCVSPRDFPMLACLLRAGELRIDAMIGRTCRLDEVNDALALFERGEERRTVIVYER